MNEKLRAMLAGLTAEELAALEAYFLEKIKRSLDALTAEDDSLEYIPTTETGSIDFGAWEDLENARAAEEFEATGRRIQVRDFYASEKMMWQD